MADWVGCLGPESSHALAGIPDDRCIRGNDFALAVIHKPGEPVHLTQTDRGVRAAIGDVLEAGCAATIDLAPGGPTITLACDPFGLHGVTLAQVGESFWFASDVHLLRQTARIEARLRPDAVHGYLCFAYVPTPTTLYTGIDALPAGTTRTFTFRKPYTTPEQEVPLWNEQEPFLTDPSGAALTLEERLRAATDRQLGTAREVGVFLSGGLDSSLVAALLAKAGARLHLYTLDFGLPYNAELPYAQAVAAHLKRPLHIISATAKEAAKALRPAAAAMQQPFADPVCVPLYLLGQAASQEVDTVFNGEFGDQLFGGWANKPMIAAELYGPSDPDRVEVYLATFHRFYGRTDALYTPAMRQATAQAAVGTWIRPALEQGRFRHLLHRLRAANLQLKGAQNIGPRMRQLAAANGLRIRAPFCDRALTDWTFTCPPEWFLQGACEKYLLKQVAEKYLPADIVWREKRGMGVPATEWCRGGLRRPIGRLLHPRRLQRDGLFRPETVLALCRGNETDGEYRSRRLGERLWTLLMLHLWKDMTR